MPMSLEDQLKHRPANPERVAELKEEVIKQIPEPLWPHTDEYEKPVVRKVAGFWIVVIPGEKPSIHSTETDAAEVIDRYVRADSTQTEYTQRREALAEFLCDLVYGKTMWSHNSDANLSAHYRLDADDIIKANPHLLSLTERERLMGLIPELEV